MVTLSRVKSCCIPSYMPVSSICWRYTAEQGQHMMAQLQGPYEKWSLLSHLPLSTEFIWCFCLCLDTTFIQLHFDVLGIWEKREKVKETVHFNTALCSCCVSSGGINFQNTGMGSPEWACSSCFEARPGCVEVQGVWHGHEVTLPGSSEPQLSKAIAFQTPNVGNCY